MYINRAKSNFSTRRRILVAYLHGHEQNSFDCTCVNGAAISQKNSAAAEMLTKKDCMRLRVE